MQVKSNTDYAFRILVYLAIKRGVANSKEIADSLDIPQKNVLGIGRRLKANGLVKIISGPYGGYIMNKSPEDISLFDIFSMFEDTGLRCRSEKQNSYYDEADRVVDKAYSELESIITEKLRAHTLSDRVSHGLSGEKENIALYY